MEIQEGIPSKGDKIIYDNIAFTVESADSRRIKRVKMHIEKRLNLDESNA